MEEKNLNENIFKNPNHYKYLVQYQGDIQEEILKYSDFIIKIINDKYAILSIPKEKIYIIDNGVKFNTIVYIKPPEMFTLQQISPKEASQADFLQLELPLNLPGTGVNIAILDTGIDYLNEEFSDENGQSRIDLIWDQTLNNKQKYDNFQVPFGEVFLKSEIQKAIDEYKKGNDPYNIVPTVDEIGHGTKMAGLIGATGINPDLKGIAFKSNFIILKLVQDYSFIESFRPSVEVYNIATIFAALEFLYEFSLNSNKPLIIYFPLGSNLGNHRGHSILDQFIEFISVNTTITIITGTGNEQNTRCHASGTILSEEHMKIIDLNISKHERNLWLEIWADVPNIVSVDVISPSGENSGIINSLINETNYYTYVFEKTSIKVNYYIPEELSGDQLIRIRFYDLQPGIWKLRINGELILDGRFNIWIPQKGITDNNTYLSPSDTYGTVTNPGNSAFSITVAAYNQNSNNLVDYSGMSFDNEPYNIILVAAGGVNAITIAPKNNIAIVNGTSVSSAIVAGICAMLYQWGIVEKNDINMCTKTLRTYLARGVVTRSGDIYPNAQWGYGIINVINIFNNIY